MLIVAQEVLSASGLARGTTCRAQRHTSRHTSHSCHRISEHNPTQRSIRPRKMFKYRIALVIR